jgi:hypothetical protein
LLLSTLDEYAKSFEFISIHIFAKLKRYPALSPPY